MAKYNELISEFSEEIEEIKAFRAKINEISVQLNEAYEASMYELGPVDCEALEDKMMQSHDCLNATMESLTMEIEMNYVTRNKTEQEERVFVRITANSNFGGRSAIYKIVEDILVIRDEGDHDNLAGNGEVCNFEGLTLDQADEKINAANSESVGHSYDGCHACTWNISLRRLALEDVPPHLTYNEPAEAFAIKEALKVFRSKRN
jgi:hypothetical protein